MNTRSISVTLVVEGYTPRRDFHRKEELKRSIEREGLLEPLTVRKDGAKYIIIDGVMRFRAVQELGWKTVDCIIIDADEEKSYHLAYVKNMERENLDPIEDALHLKKVQEKFGYNVEDLVRKGYAPHRSTLDDKLSLLTLAEDIQKGIIDGKVLGPSIGYELAKLPDEKSQRELAQEIIASGGMSVRKVKDKVQSLNVQRKVQGKENPSQVEMPQGEIPGVLFKDSSDMSELADESVGLIVTSPPYGVGMEYEEGVSFEEHLQMLERVLTECVRVLIPGRKICINVGDIHNFGSRNGEKPEIQLVGHFFQEILRKHGVRLVDRIIWKKCHKGKRDFNWFTNPQVSYHKKVRHTTYRILNNTEYIFVFEKDGDAKLHCGPEISKEEHYEWVDGVWEIPPVKGENGHPAPFPEELVRRLIKMYSFERDIVLDPFGGTMTTVKVARELSRRGIGYEKDLKYKPFIMKKLGVKEEDLKKSELSKEARTEAIKALTTEILPSIVEETKSKGERISRLSFTLKPNLSKKDIGVKTISAGAVLPPTSSNAPPQVSKADDYADKDALVSIPPLALAKAA